MSAMKWAGKLFCAYIVWLGRKASPKTKLFLNP